MQSLFSHQRLVVPFPWSELNNASFAAPLWFQEHIHFILADLAQQAVLGFPSSICFCKYFQAFLKAVEKARDFNSLQPGVPKFQAPIPLLLSSSSGICKMHFQIVSYFWNGLFICWSWRQASEVNSERCLQKKQNVSEVCEAIHRINKQVSQQGGPRARWETRGTSIRMGSASASTWPGLRCESEFWGPSLGQGPPIARGWLTSKADFSGNGVVAIRAVLPNFGKKNSQAEGCGCVYSLPLFQPVINRIIGNHWKT